MKELLDEIIIVYLAIDKKAPRVQTHCTLTVARGMIRMYANTKYESYLDGAKSIYNLYVNGGGDMGIMQDLYDYIALDKSSDSISDIMVSCESHLICFVAEEARLNGTTVEMKKYIEKLGR